MQKQLLTSVFKLFNFRHFKHFFDTIFCIFGHKFFKMKRAYQILIHTAMINGEQQLLPLKNKI